MKINDPLPNLGTVSPENITLLAGDTAVFTAKYTISQNDVENGAVNNTAKATGISSVWTQIQSNTSSVRVGVNRIFITWWWGWYTPPSDPVDPPDNPIGPNPEKEPTPEKPKKPKKPTILFPDPKPEVKDLFKKYPSILPQTGIPIDWNKRFRRAHAVSSYYLDDVTIELPHWSHFKLAGSTNPNLSYWLQSVVKRDRNESMYIVLPTQWLVVPVHSVPVDAPESQRFLNGSNENFWKYLINGAIELPGTTTNDYGQPGNKVISGHSSFFKKSRTRYKTHFQRIIEMDPGQQIWIYKKQPDNTYKRYIYKVYKSYNASKYHTEILHSTEESILTLFTCTPIWWARWRWVVRAKLVE